MLYDIFSKRQKLLRGETHDTFVYDSLPGALRVQLLQIIEEFYNFSQLDRKRVEFTDTIVEILRREYGMFELAPVSYKEWKWDEVRKFIVTVSDVERALDGIELFLQFGEHHIRARIDRISKDDDKRVVEYRQLLDNTLEEVNYRFREHGIGYQYASGYIFRVDSTYTHKEITLPALQLLISATFLNVNKEFLEGHEHYRHQRNGECLVSCVKAFESTMKIICDKKNWQYSSKAAAKDLIGVCVDNRLIPSSYQSQFGSLRSLLESALPPLRNQKGAAHGAGFTQVTIPNEVARYALSLTAANIILLVELSGIK